MSRYSPISRTIITENTRFFVCYDSLSGHNGEYVKDYLVIKPKISHENLIAGVCILPYIDNYFCLMKSWRHQFNSDVWQAPAGFVEDGETSIESARRELFEETALECDIKNIISLGSYIPDAGLIEGRVALYLAKGCQRTSQLCKPEIGTGQLHFFSPSSLLRLLTESTNIGGSTCMAAYRSLSLIDE